MISSVSTGSVSVSLSVSVTGAVVSGAFVVTSGSPVQPAKTHDTVATIRINAIILFFILSPFTV